MNLITRASWNWQSIPISDRAEQHATPWHQSDRVAAVELSRRAGRPARSGVTVRRWPTERYADLPKDTLARGYRTRALAGGWGHSWLNGWPGYGKAISDIQIAFYPQMGWFVTNWLELDGGGRRMCTSSPHRCPRRRRRYRRPTLLPSGPARDADYVLGGGMVWMLLEAPELDRIGTSK